MLRQFVPITAFFPTCADNLNTVSGSRMGDYLVLEFSRPLIASDQCDIAIIPNMPIDVIYALGPITGSGTWPYKIQFHTAHGTNTSHPLTFIAPTSAPTSTPVTASNSATSASQQQQSSTSTCVVGRVSCPCTAGGGCDPGLVCSSNLCVTGSNGIVIGVHSLLLSMLVVFSVILW